MTALSYDRGMTLPWSSKDNEEQRFRLITAVTLAKPPRRMESQRMCKSTGG